MPNFPTPLPAGKPLTFLQYIVYSRDPADTVALRAAYGGASVLMRPARARDDLGIAESDQGWNIDAASRWITFPTPPTTVLRTPPTGAPWVANAVQGTIVYPSDGTSGPYWWPPLTSVYDFTQDWFTVPGHPAIGVWGAGQDYTMVWSCTFLSAGSLGAGAPSTFDAMRPKRWAVGFEMMRSQENTFPNSAEGNGGTAECYCRDASRTPDGIGLAFRNNSSNGVTKSLNQYISPVVNPLNSWERFYLRIRAYPTANTIFYALRMTTAGSSMLLGIDSTGHLLVYSQDNAFTLTLQATSAGTIPLNAWRQINLYLKNVVTVGTTSTLDVYVKQALFVTGTGVTHTATGVNHDTSRVSSPTPNGLDFDFDDWSNMDPGPVTAPIYQTTRDWWMGQHNQLVRPTGFGAGHSGNWTGDFRIALQDPAGRANVASITATAASSRLEVATELDENPLGPLKTLRQLGLLTLVAGYVNQRSVQATTGQVGASVNGVDSLLTVTETAGATDALNGYSRHIQISSGAADMPAMSTYEPILGLHIKGTDGNQDSIKEVQISAQFMGSWGTEDDGVAGAPGIQSMLTIHNAPYAAAYLGRTMPPTNNAAGVASGTYVGNGTGQDIIIDLPAVHWLHLRNTSTERQTFWFSSMLGPHENQSSHEILPNNMARMEALGDGTTRLRLAGGNNGGNQTGITYHYVAVCDVLSRVMINGAFKHSTAAASYANTLLDATFTPEALFAMGENVENALAGDLLFYKGPGNAANGGNSLGLAAEQANVATLAAGTLTSRASLHNTALGQFAYNVWRQTDGGTNARSVVITQYTGNGAGARTITINMNGRRPLWALVVPVSAATSGAVRDPGHTGTNSARPFATTALAGTGITAGGIDSITVATQLNTNLVVYNVFVIAACSSDAGNNGWGTDGVCGLLEAGWDDGSGTTGLPTPPSWLDPEPPEPPPQGGDACAVSFPIG